MARVHVHLEHEDAVALLKLAIAEYRHSSYQAGILLKRAVREALARLENGQPAIDDVQKVHRKERDLARMKRLYVYLEDEDVDALVKLAIAKYRHPSYQAGILLTLAIREAVARLEAEEQHDRPTKPRGRTEARCTG
jgi:hypothetical protein